MAPKLKPKANGRKALEDYMSKKSLKSTKQRDIIFEVFFNHVGSHITVEDLYEKVKENHPQIGYATIYRTLKLFVESGVAFERNFGDGKARYEPVRFEGERHDHLICIGCDKIIEFANNRIESCSRQIAKLNDFELVNHNVELYGYCCSCSEGQIGRGR